MQRLQVGRGVACLAVKNQDRSRLKDATEVSKLIGLTKGLFPRTLRSALKDSYSIADVGKDLSPPLGVFLRGKRCGEYGLCDGKRGKQNQEQRGTLPDHWGTLTHFC